MSETDFLDMCRVVADYLPPSEMERDFRNEITKVQYVFDELDRLEQYVMRDLEGVE